MKSAVWIVLCMSMSVGLAGCAATEDPVIPPTPTPTPTPVPTPTPTPQIQACTLPPSSGGSCDEEIAAFESEVASAQDAVLARHPELFVNGRILSVDDYVAAVAAELRAQGFCAQPGGPRDEVAVKVTNGWNDQYDIVLGSTGEPWTHYTVTCRPARF